MTTPADDFPALLEHLLAGEPLQEADAHALMATTLAGDLGPERLAATLTALRTRPVFVDELVGFARAMREASHRIQAPEGVVLDNCGTGGAPHKTVNVSTTAAFLVAGAGITVAKHGNRSVTRPSGSADLLERAGAKLDRTPQQVEQTLAKAGIAFLFAPTFHPAMRHAGPVRGALGIKTVFNLLGPLTNPAGATHQVLGVYHPDLVEPMAKALARLGCQGGFVLHGLPGFDEATPCGPIRYARIQDGQARPANEVDPASLGLAAATPEALAPVAAEATAGLFQDLLAGRATGPLADTVHLNVAFALVAAGRASDLAAGLDQARELAASGVGTAKWDAYLAADQRHG
ncbi:MAG: anthranilate phosphoribosyltransferase [Thermoplasmatota archaeon]